MAAVTVVRQRTVVFGDHKVKLMNINIATSGDTFATTNFAHSIDAAFADASGTTVVNTQITTAGGPGPVVFNYTGGGAQNNVDVMIIGR
jgi:hypothetical protein